MNIKIKETENRLFEIHRERQELESKLKAAQRQIEDLMSENDALRKMKGSSDEEKMELTQQMQKLRSKMTEHSIHSEQYIKHMEELELVTKQIADKAKSFLDDMLRKINASDLLSDLISRHLKEQMYLLTQNFDLSSSDSHSLHTLLRDLLSFIHLFDDEFTTILNEYLSAKTDQRLLDKKVEQLENRLASIHTTDIVNAEKSKFLSNEIDNIRQKRLQTIQEMNQMKD